MTPKIPIQLNRLLKKSIGIVLILLGSLSCQKENAKTANDYFIKKVYPQLDTEHSRWFFFSSACRPFGMVNLSPDTQIDGAWGSGYCYNTDTIKGFSHIHAWQLSGISVMPVTLIQTDNKNIYTDFYSKFSHQTEKVIPGYHYVELNRYAITAELTSTKRVGFHKYTYPKSDIQKSILFNLNTHLGPCENTNASLKKISNTELHGSIIMQPTSRRPKPVTLYFNVKLNTPVQSIEEDSITKNYLINFDSKTTEVLMKIGVSYTSNKNAGINLQKELPEWNFDEIVAQSKDEWNSLLGRIQIEGGSETEQKRFYTDLWHSLQGRRLISDVNGAYPDNTQKNFRIGQIPLDKNGNPEFNHYNSDSFWGAQWTINTLWGLVYPEIMDDFVHSLLQYYKDGGLIPRGPSGGNYTYVMTGASSTPFIVSAIQKDIVKDSLNFIYEALKKNHMPGGIMAKAGYEHKTEIGGGLSYYIKNGYIPYPLPDGKFASHEDGVGQTLEYAYQDWVLAQLAKKLNKEEDYSYFIKRSENYKNVFNKAVGWMAPRTVNGNWLEDFDPYQYGNGFVESNAAQSTWFVPHDLKGLSELMGGEEKAVEKLNKQFETAEKLGFTSGDSHEAELHPEYSRIPINYGNQPSIETAFIFNELNRPDLTQYWSRKVVNKVFSGLSPNCGFNGDEDQGLMGSLSVLMKIGLFQMNGGTEKNPAYQIGSPAFNKITIHLNTEYYKGKEFIIESKGNSPENVFIKKASLSNTPLTQYKITHNDIINGGILQLIMSNK
jgi:predicted alpha-1,2-mannosidase